MTREQERAAHAFVCIRKVGAANQKNYKILVNEFGTNIIRSGLMAAIAFIQRYRDQGVARLFFEHLAGASIPGLHCNGGDLAAHIKKLEANEYMFTTREFLKIALWFKRAAQAELSNVAEDEN